MRQFVLLAIGLCASLLVQAQDIDLSATMKKMKFEFKQAAQAQTLDEMQLPIENLRELVSASQSGQYPKEKQALYLEGFEQLSLALDNVQAKIDNNDFTAAQVALKQVDELRVDYHKRRNSSIWQKIFG